MLPCLVLLESEWMGDKAQRWASQIYAPRQRSVLDSLITAIRRWFRVAVHDACGCRTAVAGGAWVRGLHTRRGSAGVRA